MATDATVTGPATRPRRRRRPDDASRLHDRIGYRRSILLNDAREVSELFAPHLAVLVCPAGGNATVYANPTVESVLRTYLPPNKDYGTETADQAAARVGAMRRETRSIHARVTVERAQLFAVARKVKAAQVRQEREHWWEVDVDSLPEADLPDFARALDVLRAEVLRRIGKLANAPEPPQRQ
uniref:Uncharacterized protein n=1 Tax=Avena sativa TaxID=4498 RepID=A0ACD5WUV0_AVESA